MGNVLRANLSRLLKDKYLWISCAVCILLCVIDVYDSVQSARVMAERGVSRCAEDYLYNAVLMPGLLPEKDFK